MCTRSTTTLDLPRVPRGALTDAARSDRIILRCKDIHEFFHVYRRSTISVIDRCADDPQAEDRGTCRLLLGMFVAFLSSTIVSNALPTIITELHGTQDQYTWVVTATLLASTATTPIWGKFSDLVSKKLLVQLSITLFTIGSILAGMSQSVGMLIGFRAVQGLGLGGLQAS